MWRHEAASGAIRRLRGGDVGVKRTLAESGPHAGTHVSLTYAWRDAAPGFGNGMTFLGDGRGAALDPGARVAPVVIARLQTRF